MRFTALTPSTRGHEPRLRTAAAKKRAVVAMARKLSVLLLRLWVTGEVYEPLRTARRRGELAPSPA